MKSKPSTFAVFDNWEVAVQALMPKQGANKPSVSYPTSIAQIELCSHRRQGTLGGRINLLGDFSWDCLHTVGQVLTYGRDAPVGVDVQVPTLLLLSFVQADRLHFARNIELLHQYICLPTVRGSCIAQASRVLLKRCTERTRPHFTRNSSTGAV